MIQHKKKKSNKIHLITVLILVALIFISGKSPESFKVPSNIINTILTPVNRVVYSITNAIDEGLESIFGSIETREKIASLEQEVSVKDEKLRQLEAIVSSKEYLQAEYDLLNSNNDKFIQGYVTGMDGYGLMKKFTINLGSFDGIQVNDIVVQGVKNEKNTAIEGLVGRVTEVGANYSKVSAIIDDSIDLSFRNSKTNEIGIINQKNGQYLYGSMLDENSQVKIGDTIISSGVGGIYPKGIYIGRVIDVELSKDGLTKNLTIESPVEFDKLYRVLVLTSDGEKNE